jgi:hypothetical protein
MGASDLYKSYTTLIEKNFSNGVSGEMSSETAITRVVRSYEKIYFAHNHTVLLEFSEGKVGSNAWDLVTEEEVAVFFQDPSIPKTIKKRVFMCAVSNKFIKNAEEWSNHVGMILHVWHRKQHYEKGKYIGSFDITLFIGVKRLNCRYDHRNNSYLLKKNNLHDPIMIKEMLNELCEILECTLSSLVEKSGKGGWQVVEDKVLPTIDVGFDMKEVEIPPAVEFTNCTLVIEYDWTRLLSEGRRVFNIETGLISCAYKPTLDYDFRVFGLKLSDVCEMGAFNQNFNVGFISRKVSLDALHDLVVPRPKVTQVTKRKLPVTKDWTEHDAEDTATDVMLEDTTDRFMDSLINQDFGVYDYKELVGKPMGDDEERLDQFVSALLKTDVIYSMRTSQRLQHSRKIFLLISNLKYDLICHQVNPTMRSSSRLIKMMGRMFTGSNVVYIEYSLISLYDRLYPTDGSKSPENLRLDVEKRFIYKFELDDEMGNESDE